MSASAIRGAGQGVEVGANPFSRRVAVAIVLLGSALFVALLWMIGTGTGMVIAQEVGRKGLRVWRVDDSNCPWHHSCFMS